MSFDTVTFWIFFAVAWTAWRFLPFAAAKSSALLLSLFFYGWWNPWYIPLICISAVVDFVSGNRIFASEQRGSRRAWLILSLISNLGLLAVFKYGPFALQNISALAHALGFEMEAGLVGWVIPVGISFYTFQTLSYSIDIYRGRLQPISSFRDFFLFVAFFPQLVAGPIVRAGDLLPQFRRRRPLHPQAIATGLYFVISGLFLKIVIADNLGPMVARVFDTQTLPVMPPLFVWLGVIYFSVQIFADFAGYSGIAIGLAYLMGLRFPLNFRYPYISRGLSEFWTRWHISLSSWLRDYLYISMGGSRRGPRFTYFALMATMLLGGLWHGPAWTFVAWGGLHGLGLCVERLIRGERRPKGAAGRPSSLFNLFVRLLQIAVVYVFVLITWVFFRAETFGMAWLALRQMFIAPLFMPFGFDYVHQARHLVLVLPVLLLHGGQLIEEWYGVRKRVWMRATLAALFLLFLIVVRREAVQEFIYFQF